MKLRIKPLKASKEMKANSIFAGLWEDYRKHRINLFSAVQERDLKNIAIDFFFKGRKYAEN